MVGLGNYVIYVILYLYSLIIVEEFLLRFYRIAFGGQDFPSPPGYLGYLRVPNPNCQ
jgi:hypothetical protein